MKKTPKRGRPRKAASERLSRQVNARFTKGEFPLLTRAAGKMGVVKWARLSLLAAAKRKE